MLNKKVILIISIIIITSLIIVGCDSNPISDNSDNGDSNLDLNKTLNITVTDEDTQDLLSDVNLTIQTEEGEITGTTDSNGVYSVEAKFIEGDNYNVTANKNGYEQKTVTLNVTTDSDNITLDITLKNDPNVAVVSNGQEMEDAFQDSNVQTIILAYNITINGETFLVVPRDLTIDGDDQYKITGPGYIRIRPEGGNHNLTFKNLTFDPDDDITKWYEETDPVDPSRYYYLMLMNDPNNNSYVVNTTLDNCLVDTVDNQDKLGSFLIDFSGADITVINSDINVENHIAFNMNRGGRGILRNNDFNKTGSVLHSNNIVETTIYIEDNNFENLPNNMTTMYLNTTFNDTNTITVNSNDLRPMDGSTVTKENFEDDALLIHQSIGNMNTVASNYLTSYFDDDNPDGYFLYEGNSTTPWYP